MRWRWGQWNVGVGGGEFGADDFQESTDPVGAVLSAGDPVGGGRSQCTGHRRHPTRQWHFASNAGDPPLGSRKTRRRVRPRTRILLFVRRSCLGDDLPVRRLPQPNRTVVVAAQHNRVYHLHTSTSVPFGAVATATRWPGCTRSTRGEGNIGANPTELTSPSLQTSQGCSATPITRAVRRRPFAGAVSSWAVDLCMGPTEPRPDQTICAPGMHVGDGSSSAADRAVDFLRRCKAAEHDGGC
jgi:hypothetical protein